MTYRPIKSGSKDRIMEKTYKARLLTEEDYTGFESVYNDFKERAVDEYKFELQPLEYRDFISSIKKELIKCIVLLEDSIPVAFLIYTTSISEAVELNIIHSYNMENIEERAKYLIEEFLRETEYDREDKVVCYPMLGAQKNLIHTATRYKFKFIGIVVLRFMMFGTNSKEILAMAELSPFEKDYELTDWNEEFFDDAVAVVNEAFTDSADALFDPRFKTREGTDDIITKIVKDLYAEFLPEATTVLLYHGKPVGFCFMNLTGGQIANIPIMALSKEHQGKGLSKHMLKKSVENLIRMAESGTRPITEVNTTTETNNFQALKLYRHIGFKEDYNYPQAYLPVS